MFHPPMRCHERFACQVKGAKSNNQRWSVKIDWWIRIFLPWSTSWDATIKGAVTYHWVGTIVEIGHYSSLPNLFKDEIKINSAKIIGYDLCICISCSINNEGWLFPCVLTIGNSTRGPLKIKFPIPHILKILIELHVEITSTNIDLRFEFTK